MSVPGLNGVGPDIATSIRLAQGAAPAAPQTSNGSAASAPANPLEDKAQRASDAALNEFLNGAAPSDALIGLYSAAPDAAANAAEQALAADAQATDIQQQNLLRQDIASDALARATLSTDFLPQQTAAATVQQYQGALAEIENSLNAALAEAKQSAFAAGLQSLLQALDAGASEEAAALAENLQAAQGEAGALKLTAISTGLPQNQAAALPALVENLIAATQAGDMTAAAFFAQAIRRQMDEAPVAPPPDWLAALAAARAGALAPPLPDVAADPLLQAYQASLLIGVKTTLNKLRKLREDRMKILPILALEDGRISSDE